MKNLRKIEISRKVASVYLSCDKIEQVRMADKYARLAAAKIKEDPAQYFQVEREAIINFFFADFWREPSPCVREGCYFFSWEDGEYVKYNGSEEHFRAAQKNETVLMSQKVWRKDMLLKKGREYMGCSEEEANEILAMTYEPVRPRL